MKRILIMGLPGTGKTTLATEMTAALFFDVKTTWLNADVIRERYDDWDFSMEGRLRQAHRMRELADEEISDGRMCICDFVAPTEEIRNIFDADYTIWMDTLSEGRYEDTNKVFEKPSKYNYRVTEHQEISIQADLIIADIFR